MNKIRKTAIINALLTTLYIIFVGLFMYYGSLIKIGKTNEFLAPITMLSLFVFSAALTGYLIVGKPVQMYIDGKKKEAVSLLTNTLVIFFLITLFFITILFAFSR